MATIDLGQISGSTNIKGWLNFAPTQADTKSHLGSLLTTVITTITIVAGLAFVIYFILAAFTWITSSGDKGAVENAKNQMTQAVIGLIAVVASYFIAGIVGGVLGLNILNPGTSIGL